MEATVIDPWDTMWEADDLAYRVYFWRGSREAAWASEEWRPTRDHEIPLEWVDTAT
jgi:hypothetical protein